MIADRLEQHGAVAGFGALACGADILVAEALLARGSELNVVLASSPHAFARTSVRNGGAQWMPRYRACLERAASITVAGDDAFAAAPASFGFATQIAMGLALLRARQRALPPIQIAVEDRDIHAVDTPAGTLADIEKWRAAGGTSCIVVPPPRSRAPPPPPPPRHRTRNVARSPSCTWNRREPRRRTCPRWHPRSPRRRSLRSGSTRTRTIASAFSKTRHRRRGRHCGLQAVAIRGALPRPACGPWWIMRWYRSGNPHGWPTREPALRGLPARRVPPRRITAGISYPQPRTSPPRSPWAMPAT